MSYPRESVRPAECTPEFCARNIRGVLVAAFAPRETIMAIFRCTTAEADAFKLRAHNDLSMVHTAIDQAKHRMRPTQ